jgi:hypothetical protein
MSVEFERPVITKRKFRLSSDIPNPKHDRRCKRGVRSHQVFKKGSVVDVEDWTQNVVKDGVSTVHIHHVYTIRYEEVPSEVESVFREQDPGTDLVPETLEEAVRTRNTSVETFCEYVVREMIKDGSLSVPRAIELYDRSE